MSQGCHITLTSCHAHSLRLFRVEPIASLVAQFAASLRGWCRSLRCGVTGLNRYGIASWMLCGFIVPALSVAGNVYSLTSIDTPSTSSTSDAAGNLLDFDIPIQPLGDALSQYGITSNQPAVFMSDLLNGRTSSAVRGRYTAEAALRLLLEGTGLAIEKITSSVGDSFLLKEASQAPEAPTLAHFFSSGNYPALIQKRILSALCADARTAPGGYRVLFRFQFNAAGRIQDASLLSSTDDRDRDAALLDVLRSVQIEVPLPPTLTQQDLTMRLKRDDPRAAPSCRRVGAS
jgi:TonB family protein